jgi:hypothetical protein
MLTHYHFDHGGSRYRARVGPHPPANGDPNAMWYVSIDNGREYPACEARDTDEPGPHLEARLAEGVKRWRR